MFNRELVGERASPLRAALFFPLHVLFNGKKKKACGEEDRICSCQAVRIENSILDAVAVQIM